jgi:hypothetical protein
MNQRAYDHVIERFCRGSGCQQRGQRTHEASGTSPAEPTIRILFPPAPMRREYPATSAARIERLIDLARNRKFASISLHRRVSELSVPDNQTLPRRDLREGEERADHVDRKDPPALRRLNLCVEPALGCDRALFNLL